MTTRTTEPWKGSELPTSDGQTKLTSPARLASLDALRGFDMFWIIGGQEMVLGLAKALPSRFSNAAAVQFEHIPWVGLHAFDVIWALFMFMVGVSLSFSIAKRRSRNESHRSILAHSLQRALVLFVLGMIAQGNLLHFDLSTLHPFYSVLHGIAAGYLIATLVTLKFKIKGQAVVVAGFLLLYWLLLVAIPVPGFGRGVLTSNGNAATYIDSLIMGRFRYGENTWFLSYLGFGSSVLIGVIAGEWIQNNRSPLLKCWGLYAYGLTLLALGLVMSIWLPIIKLLWTSSFVLVAGGLSCLMMATFYLIIDVLGFKRWAFPFTIIGVNALAVYMATMLFDFRHIGDIFVGHLLTRVGRWDEVLSEAAALTVIWLILYWMYRTRSFIKL